MNPKKILCFVLSLNCVFNLAKAQFSWEKTNAEIVETGDIKWKPEPFSFTKGESVRYIDFENGNDEYDGLSKESAWKHHPWDKNASGNSKECNGIHTYIFKRGVFYRGQLIVKESGSENNPIRLSSSPDWGEGDAVIAGSEKIEKWEKSAQNKDIPEREDVWTAILNFTPRALWILDEKENAKRIPLARTPNWKVNNFDDVKSEWWEWNNPGKLFDNFFNKNGKKFNMGVDTIHIKGNPDFFKGAILWSEYGWVMGTPYPSEVIEVDTQKSGLVFGGQWSDAPGTTKIIRNCRYYLEDKPQYLDDPEGEFWFEKSGSGGTLYLRTPRDQNPGNLRIEAAKYLNLIDAEQMNNIEISALSFKFTNVFWKLDAPPFANKDVDPACIRLLGSGKNISIKNCSFEHVNMAVRMKPIKISDKIDKITINDNKVSFTDHGAFLIEDGGGWGKTDEEVARLYDVSILRNYLYMIGMRPNRYGQGHALVVDSAETLEISGNVLDNCYGSGIHVFGSKRSGLRADRPLCRILIHYNKVTNSMLNTNDWGGIETWQGGPIYVFNNISSNPGGFWNWKFKNHADEPACARFGHAFYLDGAFKNYHFNNIACGKSSDPYDMLGNTSAFQEIHSYQNTFFNNTIYNFVIGSRRQAPAAGRNKYIANIWDNIGYMVFRHSDPAKTTPEPNQADVGEQGEIFAYNTNVYTKNVFHKPAYFDDKSIFGVFEANGRTLKSFDDFKNALIEKKSMQSELGVITEQAPLRNSQNHDFRPTENSIVAGNGAKVFVPWPLYAVVGEWNFYHSGGDPTDIIDEHWYMTPYYTDRTQYHKQPIFNLKGVNISEESYVESELEDWCKGALKMNGISQFAFISNDSLQLPKKTEKKAFPQKSCDWAKIALTDTLTIGKETKFNVKLLKDFPEGATLQADFHWHSKKKYEGMNAQAGAHKIKGEGPYEFSITPINKPNLEFLELVLFVTPDGTWKNKIVQHMQKVNFSEENHRLRCPQIENDSFIIECYLKIEENSREGIIIEKMKTNGYSLSIDANGKANFKVLGKNSIHSISSLMKINDGKYHHIIAECNRKSKTLKIYVDGKLDSTSEGPDASISLANFADLFVGGSPKGRCLKATFDFLRISQGSIEDAKTNIEELYKWQFDGPFLRDFNGKKISGKRCAGAIQ